MQNDLNKFLNTSRLDYSTGALDIATVNKDPLLQFEAWMAFAIAQNYTEPNAMTLSTVSEHNRPSSRIVLLRGYTAQGFVFYTNYESKKGIDLKVNHFAALNFFWPSLEKQIRIEGTITKVSPETSDNYFNSRPYDSRIGAVASNQSSELTSRDVLEQKVDELKAKYSNEVPRPNNWGGYLLAPDYFEFWQGRSNRLHDRICYTLDNNSWEIKRLSP
jgi:pyridoxamine 5'-phosphate oxidase